MKALGLCLLLCLAAGCTHPDQRQAAPLTLPEASIDAPVKQENKQEAQAQSQLAGVQFGKLEAEANALKLENGDLKNDVAFLKAEKSTLLSEISLVKADNLKLTGVQMDNAKLQNEIAAVQVRNGNLTQELALVKAEKIQLADKVDSQAQAMAALQQNNVQLQEEVNAGRDVIQLNGVHVVLILGIVALLVGVIVIQNRSFNARLKDIDASRARAVDRENKLRGEFLSKVLGKP